MKIKDFFQKWAAKTALNREVEYIRGGLFHYEEKNGSVWLLCGDKAIAKLSSDIRMSELTQKNNQMAQIAEEYEHEKYGI